MKFTLALLLLASPLFADDAVRCGGRYKNEDLTFKLNPLNSVYSAYSSDESLMVFVDLSRADRVRVVYSHGVTDADWVMMEKLREAPGSSIYELLSRLGSMQTTQVWTGFTGDNYLHFEVDQRELRFSFSCSKGAISTPEPPAPKTPDPKDA